MNTYLVTTADDEMLQFEFDCVNSLLVKFMEWSTSDVKKVDVFKTYVNSIDNTKYEDAIFLFNQLVDFEDQQIKEIAIISDILYSA